MSESAIFISSTNTQERERPEDGRGVLSTSVLPAPTAKLVQEVASSGGATSSAARVGDWMCTASGVRFYPCDPRPEDIFIRDIAHALAIENRFGGHLPQPYSVAQHCVLTASIVMHLGGTNEEQRWALLHDAAEAYVKDIPRPLKRALGVAYGTIERRVQVCIAERFGLSGEMPAIVKRADEMALTIERRDLFAASHKQFWTLGGQDQQDLPPIIIGFIQWERARTQFTFKFAALFGSDADRHLNPLPEKLLSEIG